MALIPPFYLDCVVAIGTLNDEKEKVWIGTGFLFGKFLNIIDKDNTNYGMYLVTNKHVIKDLETIVIRFNPQNGQSSKDYIEKTVDSYGKFTWCGHPNENIDVAVTAMNGQILQQQGMKFGVFASDKTILTKEMMIKQQVSEGDGVFILGFPMGLVGQDSQHVILRTGAVARIRDFFEGRNTDFIVDAFVFPGNSGGPVIMKPEMMGVPGTNINKEAKLIGLIKSYIPYRDTAISQQTGKPRIIFEENTGLSLVESVDSIIETIEEYEKVRGVDYLL